MIRKSFVMSVHPEFREEYEKRHQAIWPELAATLKKHGAHNYSIYLDEKTNALYAYVEIEDEARWNAIADTEACRRWWNDMKDIMPSAPDGRPHARDLREVFHLE